MGLVVCLKEQPHPECPGCLCVRLSMKEDKMEDIQNGDMTHVNHSQYCNVLPSNQLDLTNHGSN